MSAAGQLETHGEIENWEAIRQFLYESNADTDNEESDWSNTGWGSWGNDDDTSDTGQLADKKENSAVLDKPSSTSWIDECVIAYSPVGDALAIAKGPKAIFFTSESYINTDRVKYSKCFQGILSEEDGETITSIACIPLVSQKRTSPGAPDWTCFVVGFSRGFVRIYTETGSLLVSQQFHNERVQSFKVRSFIQSRVSLQHDQLEEVIVIYRSVLVTLDGFGLFQTLRGCRNHLARMKANATESIIEPPVLSSKKWGFENEQTVVDCEANGVITPCTFDHLFTASVLGGFHATPNQNPPTASVFTTVGRKPFLAFHHAQENQALPVLTEMAYAVASKVKSSILNAATGWLGFGGSSAASTPANPAKEIKTFEVPTPMSLRSVIADHRRHGTSILCSPTRNLSVVTDGLGRVSLIDNLSGLVVRLWKGYRDAQCAWVQVDEHLSSRGKGKDKEHRTALFLVIYAPRQERLEVFAMQQGPKVANFQMKQHGRLLSATFGMMGLNNVQQQKGKNKPLIECLFMDCEGQVFTVNIPFHLGLCDKGSSKVKDLHLLKALQKLLREGQYNVANILDIVGELRTQSMLNQGFRILTQKCTKAHVLHEVLQTYSDRYCKDDDKDLSVVFQIGSLLELYQSLVFSQAAPPSYTPSEMDLKNDKSLIYCLHASEKEITILEKMAREVLDEQPPPRPKAVTFESDSGDWNLNEFFGCFALEFDPNKIKALSAANSTLTSPINFKYDGVDKFGELLFCGCLNGTTNLIDWEQKLRDAGLVAAELLVIALKYWCQNTMLSSNYVMYMEKLYHVLKCLCDLQGYTSVISDFNQVSPWWEGIRKEISSSSDIFPIYSFAIVCRGVAIDYQQQQRQDLTSKSEKVKENAGISESSEAIGGESSSSSVLEGTSTTSIAADFENISLDLLKWNILLKQIEDLSLLSSILVQKPQLDTPQLPVLKGQVESLTVIKLLDKGKGCIAELVGRWLTTIGIEPQLITKSLARFSQNEKMQSPSTAVSKTEAIKDEVESGTEPLDIDQSSQHVLDLLRSLRENFSVSLSSSIILSNYCWEYCLEWKNETDNVEYLAAAVKCAGSISSPYIRQGMISMMWTIFVSKKFATVVNISKTSREKLADKTGGFTTPEKKLSFLDQCVQFLDLFMEASSACDGTLPPPHSAPKNHWSNEANSNASLTDLALLQPLPNFDMILLHYQLALCAQFFYTFRLRGTMKPTNLFDTKCSMLLFQSLQNPTPISHFEVDLALKVLREDFLCRTISGAIRAISEEKPAEVPPSPTSSVAEFKRVEPSIVSVKECENWVTKCLDLARTWRMDLDGLRITYACGLYSCGWDLLGVEAIPLVQARDILGTKLLLIAGMRTSYIVNQRRENITDVIAAVSTNLSKWLDMLEYSNLHSLRFSKESIGEMLVQILQLIPESSYDFKLAEELLQLSDSL